MPRNNTAEPLPRTPGEMPDAPANTQNGTSDQPSFEQVSLLQSTDWNEEWKRLQRIRRKRDDSQFWNKRSKNFSSKDIPNPYVERFLALADIQPGESVLDMGCGTGGLAVPLALDGHPVIAADFSQGMLDEMGKRTAAADAHGIDARLVAWDDDWAAAGLTPNSVDVAFASRSIATSDMRAALAKLTAAARRRCCITLSTGCSPRMDARILAACGVRNTHGNDYQYAWNILVNDGFEPTVGYIRSIRKDTFDSLDEACTDFGRMIDDTIDARNAASIAAAKARMRSWLQENLVANESVGEQDKKGIAEKSLRLKEPRIIVWAFIAWSTESDTRI